MKRSLSLGVAVAVIAAVFSLGTITSAQTSPVACTVSQNNVNPNTAVIVTATGGNGTYAFTGGTTGSSAMSGNQYTVTYQNAGTYPVTVTSGNSSATCNIVVNSTVPSNTNTNTNNGTVVISSLACAPASQSVNTNTSAAFTATGGDGNYVWSGQNLNILNATGAGFQVSYPSAGSRMITVTSAGQTANCMVNVINPNAGVIPVIPSFPNTGEAFGE